MVEPRRNHYAAPSADDASEAAFDAAVVSLGELRGMGRRPDGATRLHLLASLIAEAERRLGAGVAVARDEGCSWAQIADLLGVTRASAWQRYAGAGATPAPGRRSTEKSSREPLQDNGLRS